MAWSFPVRASARWSGPTKGSFCPARKHGESSAIAQLLTGHRGPPRRPRSRRRRAKDPGSAPAGQPGECQLARPTRGTSRNPDRRTHARARREPPLRFGPVGGPQRGLRGRRGRPARTPTPSGHLRGNDDLVGRNRAKRVLAARLRAMGSGPVGRAGVRAGPRIVRADGVRRPGIGIRLPPKRARRRVRRPAGEYRDRLLPLPAFSSRTDGARAAPCPPRLEICAMRPRMGLVLTGHFLARHVLSDRGGALPPARARLVERFSRRNTISSDISVRWTVAPPAEDIRDTALTDALSERYLAYALSTITARSLPTRAMA